MSVNDDLMRAEAIREVRASGCTLPGVAELIVEFHGSIHVLTNVPRIQALGEECAGSDSEQGAKMRTILQEAAKAEAKARQATAETQNENVLLSAYELLSKPSESQSVPDATTPGAGTGSASDAAEDVPVVGEPASNEPGTPEPAAGSPEVLSPSAS
jgi:hypothetical protein